MVQRYNILMIIFPILDWFVPFMLLTDTKIRAVKPASKEINMSDGKGTMLYCRIRPNGSKLFIFRYTFNSKHSNICFGSYPDITLKRARELAQEYRALLADGINPKTHKDKQYSTLKCQYSFFKNPYSYTCHATCNVFLGLTFKVNSTFFAHIHWFFIS